MASTRAPAPTARPAFNYDDDSEVEVIEDSEPEREERREQARIEKRRIQRAVPSSSTLGSAIHSTPSWLAPPTQPTQSTVSTSSSAVSSKPPDDDSQTLFVPIATSSAPVRPVAPPPWLVPKDAPPMPDSAIRPDPTNLQRTKHASQPSPVKQLDLNSFAFHKRTSGARTVSGSKSSRSASSSKATDTEDPSTSKVPPAPSAKSSSLSKAFHLGATNGSSTTDVTFSAGQIASITSCVVCGNSWTVRKQPKSKWTHITTCARKHGCGIDSLHLKLVAAVVEASEEKAREAAKGKEKEKEPAAPKSLLAHTVQERAPPQRRGRRKAPGPSTLRSVEEAQKSILQRSMLLLGAEDSQQDENEPRPAALNQGPEPENDRFDIPATQVFAPSKIGGGSKFFGSTTSMLNTDSASGLLYADEPRSFVLGSHRGSPTYSPLSSVASNHDIRALSPSSPPGSPPLSMNTSIISIESSNDHSSSDEVEILNDRTRSPARSDSSASVIILDTSIQKPARAISLASDEQSVDDGNEWDSRDGVYMWEDYVGNEDERPVSPAGLLVDDLLALTIQEPQDEVDGLGSHGWTRSPRRQSKSFVGRVSPTKDIELVKKHVQIQSPRPWDILAALEPPSKTHVERSGSPDLPTPAAPPTKGKSKRKPKTTSPRPPKVRTKKKTTIYAPEDVDNDEEEVTPSRDIDAQLLMIITSDQTLYLRILRYEPIKFEDIFEMALANGIPKQGLQIKLKSFLDSQCINFYSGDNLGRRKRH